MTVRTPLTRTQEDRTAVRQASAYLATTRRRKEVQRKEGSRPDGGATHVAAAAAAAADSFNRRCLQLASPGAECSAASSADGAVARATSESAWKWLPSSAARIALRRRKQKISVRPRTDIS